MKIGNYVSYVAGRKGYERNVSGHVQVPLRGMQALRDAGHEVHLITNPVLEGYSMPACMPEGVRTHFVEDARERVSTYELGKVQKSRLRPAALMRQVTQIRRIAHEQRFDVLHFHGYNLTAYLAGGMKLMGLRTPVVMSLLGPNFPERAPRIVTHRLWRRIDAMVTATDYVAGVCAAEGLRVDVVRHGPIRELRVEHGGAPIGPRNRVLFWRDPTTGNGADIVAAVYDALAPEHPDLSFDMAIRPSMHEVEGLEELPKRHANVHIHRFPYPPGVTLPGLVLESLCVVMPIRQPSIDPQLVIAESMQAGAAVVAPDLRSIPEMIEDGVNGLLVPAGDTQATLDAVRRLLDDRERTLEMGRAAADSIARKWNWERFTEQIVAVYESVAR